jgi:hypothetical protein
MAWQIVAWVLDNPSVRGNLKLVAILLANYANDKGIAWPSVETLAKQTGLSTRQIQRILPQIEKAGLVKISTGGGRKRTHKYQFTYVGNHDNLSSFPHRNGDNLSQKGDTMSPDPLITKEKKKNFPGGNKTPRKIKVAL